MIRRYQIPEKLDTPIRKVESSFMSNYGNPLTDEERSTGYLLGNLQDEFNKINQDTDKFEIRTFAYKREEEKRSGPDFGLRYQVITNQETIPLSVIVQAKKEGKHDSNLPNQCYRMLNRTSESYVCMYSENGIKLFPAMPIFFDRGTGGKFSKYYETSFRGFLQSLFRSYIGDIMLAREIDKPSNFVPSTDRVKFLLDIAVSTVSNIEGENVYRDYVEEEFGDQLKVNKNYYTKIPKGYYDDLA